MKRILAVAALLLLGACANPSASPTATTAAIQTELLRAELLYEVVQKGAVLYVERPTCTVPKTIVLCATDTGRTAVRKANRAANIALDRLETLAATPGITSGALSTSFAAVVTAAEGVTSILAIYK